MMSGPLQKMVVVTQSQINELEQKKKRQTLERAKANHLSKQLQMRLQYAKLKVEHGWQRQNLNEVENLYFHHSHQRHIRQGAGKRIHYAMATYPHSTSMPAETQVQSPVPSTVPDRTVGPSPLANDASLPDSSASPPSQSPPEHPDGRFLSYPASHLGHVQAPVPATPNPPATSRPSSALDFSDPNILARLTQLQAQAQLPSQSHSQPSAQAQAVSRHPSTTVPSTSASQSSQIPLPIPIAIPAPGTFPSSHPQPFHHLGITLTPSSVPLYPFPAPALHNPPAPPQQPIPASAPALGPTIPIPATSIPTPTPIAPSALTYDSFWSTHASSASPTRALYRTHTGFTASATPGGNVAMLTPGGHAAVMTAEGVYVGGGVNK